MRPSMFVAAILGAAVSVVAAPDSRAPRAAEPAAAAAASLPRVSIRTERRIRDEPKVRGRMRVAGSYDGLVGIELRGQSSQTFAKKSYGVELRTRSGKDRRAALLGLPADGDWVLHGPWIDKTLMRNALAYDLARDMGRWAPSTRHVELTVNGRYQGVYLLSERAELSRNRLDVENDGVSGAYLVEWTFPYQARRKGAHFTLPISRRPIVYEDPELRDLEPAERRYLRGFLRRTERAVYGRGGSWRRLLDEAATIDYVLVQEVFRNVDAFHGSTFLVKEAGEKLRFGPVWDFDLSTGNVRQRGSASTRGWWTPSKQWVGRLWRDCRFRDALGDRWRELVGGGTRGRLLAQLDRHRATLAAGPAGRNFRRWPTLDERLWHSPAARGTYAAEVRYLRAWLVRRMDWMTRASRRLRC
jgi:hypothetical protein